MKIIIGLTIAAIAATPAAAAVTVYTVSGKFSDDTTFGGTFNYDDVANAYSMGSIVVGSGTLSAFTYDSSRSRAASNGFSRNSVMFINADSSRYINLAFASTLAGSIGPVALLTGAVGLNRSWECTNCAVVRSVVAGSVSANVTGAVPEPATWAMMLVGFAAVGFALRRNRKPQVRIRFT